MNPERLPAPTGYAHVVETSGGRTLYVSGQIAVDASGGVVGTGSMREQATRVFENLKAALAAADATLADVVKITVFVTDMSDIQAFRDVRRAYLGDDVPASTLVQVVRLARRELLIEIEAIAVVTGPTGRGRRGARRATARSHSRARPALRRGESSAPRRR
jgi:reactive intermediate/imine deaminase